MSSLRSTTRAILAPSWLQGTRRDRGWLANDAPQEPSSERGSSRELSRAGLRLLVLSFACSCWHCSATEAPGVALHGLLERWQKTPSAF